MKTYKIIRFYRQTRETAKEIKETGLNLEQAQEHCNREDTHEKDCNGNVIWFDGYAEE